VLVLADLFWAPVGIYYARVGDGGTCSPNTVTCPKKNTAHNRGPNPGRLRRSRRFSPLRHSAPLNIIMSLTIKHINFYYKTITFYNSAFRCVAISTISLLLKAA